MTPKYIRNLLEETLQYIKENCGKKTTNDVIWVGSVDGSYAITWNEFEKIAGVTEYGQTGAPPEIATDLVIVFNDETWLARNVISEIGIEEWQVNSIPKKHPHAKPFSRILNYNVNNKDRSIGTKIHDYNFW